MQKSSGPKSCIDPVQLLEQAREEYYHETAKLKFSKDFNSSLEAIMHDPMASWSERFTAWLKRYSWGEYSLYAIRQNGEPRTLADAAREIAGPEDRLECVKASLSHTAKYMETRNYLRREGKKLYPVIAPSAPPPLQKVVEAATFSEFLEHWKVAKAATFSELETAEATIKAIKKSRLGDYKKWKRLQLSERVSLLPKSKEREENTHTHVAVVTTVACARDDSADVRVRTSPPSDHTPLQVVALSPIPEAPPEPAAPPLPRNPPPPVPPRPGPLPLTPPLRAPRQPLNPPPACPPPKEPADLGLRERFIRDYPDQSDKTALGKAYDRHVKPDSQLACDACLTRFLRSDRVARNVVDAGPKWLARQAANGFSGDWAPPPKPAKSSKPDFVEQVRRQIGQRLLRGETP